MQCVSPIGFKISIELKFINAAFAKQQSIDSVIMSRPLFCFHDDMAQSQQKEKKNPFLPVRKLRVWKEWRKNKNTYLYKNLVQS